MGQTGEFAASSLIVRQAARKRVYLNISPVSIPTEFISKKKTAGNRCVV